MYFQLFSNIQTSRFCFHLHYKKKIVMTLTLKTQFLSHITTHDQSLWERLFSHFELFSTINIHRIATYCMTICLLLGDWVEVLLFFYKLTVYCLCVKFLMKRGCKSLQERPCVSSPVQCSLIVFWFSD